MTGTGAIILLAATCFIVAVLMAGWTSHGPRLRFVGFCGLLLAIAVALVVDRHALRHARVIFIVDDASALGDTQMATLIEQYADTGMDQCDAIAIASSAAGSVQERTSGFRSRRWRTSSACTSWSASELVYATTPAEALSISLDRFASRSWATRLADSIEANSQRVVVVVTMPKAWQRWQLPTIELSGQARKTGAVIDVIRRDWKASDAIALQIAVTPRSLPPSDADAELQLELSSSLLAGDIGRTTFSARTTCTIDPGGATEFQFPPAHDTQHATQAFTLIRPVTAQSPKIPFRAFRFGQEVPRLDAGFHLVSCTVVLSLPQGREATAVGATYIDVGARTYAFVQGSGTSLRANDRAMRIDAGALDAVWKRLGRRVLYDASYAGTFSEDELVEHAQDGKLFPRLPRPPLLVILHDVTRWDELCPALGRLAAEGTTLLLSPAPPGGASWPAACGFVPATAAATGGAPVVFDRRPRVTFMLDHARTGRLLFPKQRVDPDLPQPVRDPEPEMYRDGEKLQRAIVSHVCDSLRAIEPSASCETEYRPASQGRQRYIEARQRPAGPLIAIAQKPADEADMTKVSQLAPRLAELPGGGENPLDVIRENEVFVLFAYDAVQVRENIAPLAQLLAGGAVIRIVVLRSPFADALTADGGMKIEQLADQVRARASALVSSRPGAALAFAAGTLAKRLSVGESAGLEVSLDPAVEDRTTAVADALIDELRARFAPTSTRAVEDRAARAMDQRLGEAWPPVADRTRAAPADAWAAPLLFEALEAGHDRWTARLAVAARDGRDDGAPLARPLAYIAASGRGAIVVLGYSFLEGLLDDFLLSIPALRTSEARIARTKLGASAPEPDRWGTQRVLDLVRLGADLQRGPTAAPQVQSADVVDAQGLIRLAIVQDLGVTADVDEVLLVRCPDMNFKAACDTKGKEGVRGRPVGLDPTRQTVTYEFEPTALRSLCSGAARCVAAVVRRMRVKGVSRDDAEPMPLFVDGSRAGTGNATADLRVMQALVALASYSGGTAYQPAESIVIAERSMRVFWLAMVLIALAALWTSRVVRRRRAREAAVAAADVETGRALQVLPSGAVREAGDALGVPKANQAAGAFAAYRAIEAGDQLSGAVVDDVVQYARFRHAGRRARPPRTITRMDERAREVSIVINVGMSMRIPEDSHGRATKLTSAITLCEVFAEVGMQHRARVKLHAVGSKVRDRQLGPLLGRPGAGEIAQFLIEAASHPADETTPRLDQVLEDATGIIYVSDLVNEETDRLAAVAEGFEDETGAFGVVQITSTAELALLDMCWAPAQRVLCDRTDWEHADLRRAQDALVFRCEGTFSELKGGFLRVRAEQNAHELIFALRDHPLLDLLR